MMRFDRFTSVRKMQPQEPMNLAGYGHNQVDTEHLHAGRC